MSVWSEIGSRCRRKRSSTFKNAQNSSLYKGLVHWCTNSPCCALLWNPCRRTSELGQSGLKVPQAEDIMHLAVVACGNRLEETLTMVKSALLFSIKKIKFHIFAEEELKEQFEREVRV